MVNIFTVQIHSVIAILFILKLSMECENLLDPTYDVRITNSILLAIPAVYGILF